MTFDDDTIYLHTMDGRRTVLCQKNGIEWPPPEQLNIMGFTFMRTNYSAITDAERAGMTHVFRGAEYAPLVTFPPEMPMAVSHGDPRIDGQPAQGADKS
jgi:hypothetical protein